jgi:ABC-2 type transport system ATP-binding protein
VSRSFGRREALRDLTVAVPAQSISVLLGPNGAGKTTAIRLVTGALPPSAGAVRVFGLDPNVNGSEVRRRCGVVSAKPALYDRLTGRDNLRYSASLYGLRDADTAIERCSARFGIHPALDEKVGGYSTGMKTRLALTRSILHEPELLLLDEPTSGLDPESSIAVLALIRGLASEGKTVVMCTHLLLEAEGLADHVVVMHEGTSLMSGHPDSLRRAMKPADDVEVITSELHERSTFLGLPSVQDARVDGRTVVLTVAADAALAPIVAALVNCGVGVEQVKRVGTTLEDLYFAARGVAKGEMTVVRATGETPGGRG